MSGLTAEESMGIFGNSPQEHIALGRVALNAGNHKKATAHLEKGVSKLPYYAEGHLLLWQCRIAAFKEEFAFILNDPDSMTTDFNVGMAGDPLEELQSDFHREKALQLGDETIHQKVAMKDAELEALWGVLAVD